jgi:hypothetical protein
MGALAGMAWRRGMSAAFAEPHHCHHGERANARKYQTLHSRTSVLWAPTIEAHKYSKIASGTRRR